MKIIFHCLRCGSTDIVCLLCGKKDIHRSPCGNPACDECSCNICGESHRRHGMQNWGRFQCLNCFQKRVFRTLPNRKVKYD